MWIESEALRRVGFGVVERTFEADSVGGRSRTAWLHARSAASSRHIECAGRMPQRMSQAHRCSIASSGQTGRVAPPVGGVARE